MFVLMLWKLFKLACLDSTVIGTFLYLPEMIMISSD